jgi:acyl-CoA reductase-like NAD-dependent aldehyde dehydrogenase
MSVEAPAAGAILESRAPATGELLGAVTAVRPGDADRVVAAAAKVVPLWAQLRLTDRARYLRRAAQALIDEFDELLALLTAELGRPRAEVATLELLPALDALEWIADSGPRVLAARKVDLPRLRFGRSRARVESEPLGVIAVVSGRDTPWAVPLAQVAAALMGGNGVILKPAPSASLTGERIARLFVRAGLPEGLLQVAQGGDETGSALVGASIAKLLVSGSAAGVTSLAHAAGSLGKPVVATASGHDAMLVLEDANLNRAVAGALWGAFACAGQAPGSVGRALVVHDLAERFAEGVSEAAGRLRLGDPRRQGTQVGPLATHERLEDVSTAVGEAVQRGARLRCGGPVAVQGLTGPFYAPAVLTGVDGDMRVWRERLDGPVLAVMAVDSATEAVALVNAGPTALGTSVWTDDRYRAARIARELQVGISWANDHLVAPLAASAPWGDARRGGHGRAHGEAALRACTEEKVIGWREPTLRARWRMPYHPSLEAAARALARLRSVRDADRERGLREGALPLARVALGRRRRR